ncbi:MAG: tetratricopeptide repeat protein, partial [Anaerolineales bacterium]
MSNVSLRVYNREIETMIEGGRLDEAVAHCQHILKTFPMYVEIYRLLGKSFLEARRYTDAADIFQRILMAVPDDFVAHVGMSIIRDDEGKLDDAIWHMERAYEDQPSNSAIQNELRRLYGRRDGTEPPKIRLSRDALANMYAQGELYHQAIAEIRGVLAEDPSRPDLQVMLARAYFKSGQKVEAAEVAANLLKKYTYCMDALRILVDVLSDASQTQNTQVYRQRLHMLDPYSSFVAGSVFNTDQVPDASVNLEHLEYVAGAIPASPQPNWASTLGIKLVEEKHTEPVSEWLIPGKPEEKSTVKQEEKQSEKTAESSPEQYEEKSEIAQPVLPPTEQPPSAVDQSVPDWMRTIGWKESSGTVPEQPAEFETEKPAEPLEKADIPEWLMSLAPQQMPEESSIPDQVPAPAVSTGESDIPEWLKGLGPVAAVEPVIETPPSTSDPVETHVFPDWLKEMDASSPAVTPADTPEEKPELSRVEGDTAPTQLAPDQAEVQVPPINQQSPAPTWGEDTPFQPSGEAKPLKIEDDAMGWLESLAAKQGAKEEELLIKPGERAEEMPEWLRSPKEPTEAPAPYGRATEVGKTLPLEPLP